MTVEEMREKIKEKCNYYADCNKCPLDAESSWLTGCYKYATDEEIKEYYKIMVGDDDMNKNYMSSIAEILGVEIDKGFKVYRGSSFLGTYKITENGLIYDDTSKSDEIVLEDILTGVCHIKQQWQPKCSEKYYFPDITLEKLHGELPWEDDETDELIFGRDLICKTPEEAIKLAEVALQAIKKYRE